MCGIIGSTHTTKDALERAAPCISYRGPDHTGYMTDGTVGMAHHRLSIIDVDNRSNQPMTDPQTGVVISYNGEIYNYKELRASLPNTHAYETASDTEVLLHAYAELGPALFPKLRGMFALVLYDPREKTLLLARDHAGIKPLYWSQCADTLIFSSEVKGIAALMKEMGIAPTLDRAALSLSLQFGYIPPPHTLLEGVASVAPGSCVIWDLGANKVREIQTWKPSAPRLPLPQALGKSVEEHLVSDVPVGLFFSGGVDSSLILRELKRHGAPLRTFTLLQPGKDADAEAARAIAESLAMPMPTEIPLTPESFADAYALVMDRIDEPLADTSIFPTALLASEARKEVKVVLSGEGGDELFYGYERQRILSSMNRVDAVPTLLDHAYLLLPAFRGKNTLFLFLFRLFSQPISYYLLTLSPTNALSDSDTLKRAKEIAARAGTPADLDRALYLPGNLLRKLDMATSYASIEGRVPLLDPRMYSAAGGTKPSEQFDASGGKRALRALLRGSITDSLIDRPKSGFGMWRAPFIASHEPYRRDVARGVSLLRSLGFKVPNPAVLLRSQPRFALLVATIARAYDNIGISHEAA